MTYTASQLSELAKKVLETLNEPDTMHGLTKLAWATDLTISECCDRIQKLAIEGSI